MDIYKLKWTRLQNEIFRFLCIKSGSKLNQRGIAKALNVSPTAVSKALQLLKKEDIIKYAKEPLMNLVSIELNREDTQVVSLKRAENLKMIYESRLFQFLYDSLPGATIVLFGSYSFGEDTTTSDIDIAAIGTKRKEINLKEYEKILDREIVINYYSSLKEIKSELRNNILNGIILKGSVEI
jgi:predicted nucleotidyltransferase